MELAYGKEVPEHVVNIMVQLEQNKYEKKKKKKKKNKREKTKPKCEWKITGDFTAADVYCLTAGSLMNLFRGHVLK